MKTDPSHLPEDMQEDLRGITEAMRRAGGPEMMVRVFPRSTPEEERRFDLLRRADVEARCDPEHTITRDDPEHPASRVRGPRAVVEDPCRRRIESPG